MSKNIEIKKLYARALDPVHIGAGGYRLGRVDNTIVRDPATDVPYIPGTSIAGVAKAFAEVANEQNQITLDINDAFGTGDKQGKLRFYDGQIIFFPAPSIQGTVWITTKELLEYWFGEEKNGHDINIEIPEEIKDDVYAIKGFAHLKALNLGWLLLEVKEFSNKKKITLPSKINNWVQRIVVVSDKLFSHIINDNLDVRTSVGIDPDTGTAREGALFTYEAIPGGTVFGFEVGVHKLRNNDTGIHQIIGAVAPYFKLLGIGGMGTRGFGRLEILPENESHKTERSGGEPNA